jgi:GR25 family glycosyltransferase involved in LPS biosynthesis
MSQQIKYYLIHCEEHIERLEQIEHIKKNLNNEMKIFNGYFTKYVSLDYNIKLEYLKNIDKNICMSKNTFCKPGEIGCYLSHHMLIKDIIENDWDKNGYSVIFEDDVIFESNINNEINKVIKDLEVNKMEWDLVYLGNLTRNHKMNVINNIFTIDKNNCCTGTHALLFNNKNLEKVYNSNCNIIHAIDWQYKINIDNQVLNGFVIYPPLCKQSSNLKSNIQ